MQVLELSSFNIKTDTIKSSYSSPKVAHPERLDGEKRTKLEAIKMKNLTLGHQGREIWLWMISSKPK